MEDEDEMMMTSKILVYVQVVQTVQACIRTVGCVDMLFLPNRSVLAPGIFHFFF